MFLNKVSNAWFVSYAFEPSAQIHATLEEVKAQAKEVRQMLNQQLGDRDGILVQTADGVLLGIGRSPDAQEAKTRAQQMLPNVASAVDIDSYWGEGQQYISVFAQREK